MAKGFDCEVSRKLLKEYDRRLREALKVAFENLEDHFSKKITTADMERVLCSVGWRPTPDDMNALMNSILKSRDEGPDTMVNFESFFEPTMKYLQSLYIRFTSVSIEVLKAHFDKLDINGDGTLDKYEFNHLATTSTSALLEDELEALGDYLDTDKNGIISWMEFQQLESLMNASGSMVRLDPLVYSAVRKVRFSPDHNFTKL